MVNFGYTPNPVATRKFVGSLDYPTGADVPIFRQALAETDAYLWLGMNKATGPNWKRVFQTIGDCVSQGHALGASFIIGDLFIRGLTEWIAEVASEALYGGMRVEARGGKLGGYSDGWYGSGAVKYMKDDGGVVLRIDYSPETGNPEHNMTVYDGEGKAKSWGNFGCGGKNDNGKLDAIAKKHPLEDATLITTIEAAIAAHQRRLPITICSDVGFNTGDGRNGIMTMRDANGVSRRAGSWNHCMVSGGLRWFNGKPQFRIFNSHGSSVGGPDPGFIGDKGYSDCSWWCNEEDFYSIIRQEDSFALSPVKNFEMPPWDFTNDILV